MADEAKVLDVEALDELADSLSQCSIRINRVVEDAENEIDKSLREADLARDQAADEVRFAQRELEALEDEAPDPDSDEGDDDFGERRRACEAQVEAAEERLRRIDRAQVEIKAAVERFRRVSTGDADSILRKGASFLAAKKTQLEAYLGLRPVGASDLGSGLGPPSIGQPATLAIKNNGGRVHKVNGLSRPLVADAGLANIVRALYKGDKSPNRVGSGSTADAIRSELRTNKRTGGRWHILKGIEAVRALDKWLEKTPNASGGDRLSAEKMCDDLLSALSD